MRQSELRCAVQNPVFRRTYMCYAHARSVAVIALNFSQTAQYAFVLVMHSCASVRQSCFTEDCVGLYFWQLADLVTPTCAVS
jgi:hypothetical protein